MPNETHSKTRVHAFSDDVMAGCDAVELAEMVKRKQVSAVELVEAAIARLDRVNGTLNAVEFPSFDVARAQAGRSLSGVFAGVPSFIKDNTDIQGMPTRHGSSAVVPELANRDGAFARQFLAQGFTLLGKTRLPEFGFNCTTEFQNASPTRNPWHTDYSCGGSSGGAAALVASGVVPIAHANDGGGSIRIPAACCGLVGLKPTRGRLVMHEMAKSLPVNVLCDGVVTRTVRDTAHFVYGAEKYWRNTQLPEIGLVEGPGKRRLKIAWVMDSLSSKPCPQTQATVEQTVKTLEEMGHQVELMVNVPVKPSFVDDFLDYWGFLAFMTAKVGKKQFGSRFDANRLDGFSKGLAGRFRKRFWRVPLALFRLKKTWGLHAEAMKKYDIVLTPVLGHVTPKLGYISPDVPYDLLLERLMGYASYTPLNNTNGSPAISLPLGMSQEGLPIAVQLAAGHGQERTLLELSYELEQAISFPRIDADPHVLTGKLVKESK